jgi:S1-C subfamily serine protease
MRGGVVWSHLLASILGGLVVAGVLLAFGVIGKQRTETVPINYSTAPPTDASGSGTSSDTATIYRVESPGVVHITAAITHRETSPFIINTEYPGSTMIGSGFLISRQGFILTTFHEIQGAGKIQVTFNADSTRTASIAAENQATDVALLKVNMTGVSAQVNSLPIGNSRAADIGTSVLAIANPYGLDRTLSSGIVSAQPSVLSGTGGGKIYDVLQSDVVSSPATDGGPLLDANGHVLGIQSEIEVPAAGSTYPVGFTVPIDTALKIVPKGVLP